MSQAVPAAPSLVSLSAGTRAAGGVVVFGYLLGIVSGSLVAVVGGLALATFGRALLLDRSDSALSGASLAVLTGALGAGALRWETLDLSAIRGGQSVLGPTVVLEPPLAAGGALATVGAAILALALWNTVRIPAARPAAVWGFVESAGGGLAVTTVFWGPKVVVGSSRFWADLGQWALAVAALTVATVAMGRLLRRVPARTCWVAVGVSGAAAVGGATAIVVAL